DVEHRGEPFAFAAEAVGRRHGDAVEFHGGAGIASQAEALPRAADGQTGCVARHRVKRTSHRLLRAGGAGRDHVAVRVSGARYERLPGREAALTGGYDSLACRRPEM